MSIYRTQDLLELSISVSSPRYIDHKKYFLKVLLDSAKYTPGYTQKFPTHFFCIHRGIGSYFQYPDVICITLVMASFSMVREDRVTTPRCLLEGNINVLYSSFCLLHSWLKQFSQYQHPRV